MLRREELLHDVVNLKEDAERERETKRPFSGKYVGKKGRTLVSRRDVSKQAEKGKNENLFPPCRPIEEETICPLCLDSHEENWIPCGNCKSRGAPKHF
ncbi:hypothetical protein QE152_g35678 [Popillia japonica]|uniref:Uncharacterized protein n=1 Tax=Popillia japonica TaxID=7064 RepID=A0AAW1IF92_POPJA